MLFELRTLEIAHEVHDDWPCPDIFRMTHLEFLRLSGVQSLALTLPTSVQTLTFSYDKNFNFPRFTDNEREMDRVTHLHVEKCLFGVAELEALRVMATACRARNGSLMSAGLQLDNHPSVDCQKHWLGRT